MNADVQIKPIFDRIAAQVLKIRRRVIVDEIQSPVNFYLTWPAKIWESLTFVRNGLIFLLLGLDLPEISAGLKQEGISLMWAIGYGLLVTAVLIVLRIISS